MVARVWREQAGAYSAGVAWGGGRASLWARILGVIPLLCHPSSPASSKGGGAFGPHFRQTHTAKAMECPRWMDKEVHTFIGVVGVRLSAIIKDSLMAVRQG